MKKQTVIIADDHPIFRNGVREILSELRDLELVGEAKDGGEAYNLILAYRPDIAILTNISPDHLDRYNYKYENYIASKFRITMNQTANDYLIYDADDEAIKNWLQKNGLKNGQNNHKHSIHSIVR